MNSPEHPAVARVREYFEVYYRSDSAGWAAQWIYPAGYWSGSEWHVVPDAASFARINDEYERADRAAGMDSGHILDLRCESLSPTAALVHGKFDRCRADGTVINVVQSVFVVLREGADWKVAASIARA